MLILFFYIDKINQLDFEEMMGPKGKMPWITLNSEEYADSSLIIELLSRKFQKKLSSHLTEEEKAVARAFQIMTEEHLYWYLFLLQLSVHLFIRLHERTNSTGHSERIAIFLALVYVTVSIATFTQSSHCSGDRSSHGGRSVRDGHQGPEGHFHLPR